MKGRFQFTKFKLIAGHAILLAVAGMTIWFVQRQVQRLSGERPGEGDARRKILLVSRALARLNEAEALAVAFSRESGQEVFATYSRVIREVRRDMDSLRAGASSRQARQVDTVQALLDRKIRNMKALVETRLGPAPADFYDRSLHSLERIRDTTPARPDIAVRKETSVDSVYIEAPRRGFWSFLRPRASPTLQVNTLERVVIDTLPGGRPAVQNADTALQAIREAWEDYRAAALAHEEEVHRREVAALRDGQLLSAQVKRVLNELEEEQIRGALARVDEREEIAGELTRAVATVATVACLLVIVLVALVLNDISRGQRYRKALEESNRYARKLLEGRERLMLTVTHDIKSPLNSISGYAELLDNTPLGDRQQYFLGNMKRSAGHILQLVNNLLDFSRLESGKMEVDAIRYAPGRLLAETAESFLPQAARKGLRLTCSVEEALDEERVGDPMKVRQVVTNLLSNAIKYTREGSVSLTARAAGESPGMMEIVISDTGAGMTAEEQQLIFEEFTRLDALHNDGAEGSGLGLTITRKLVELLGGSIRLESAKGEGSVFAVLLPVGALPPSPSSSPSSSSAPLRPTRVLIIDDDPLQLDMIAEFLRQKGIACETLDRAGEALEALESSSFDLLITDIQMPGCDGFTLLGQIRRSTREAIRALPVIAQSATGGMTADEFERAGFSAYLSKPYSPRQLLDCIARVTGKPGDATTELPPGELPAGEYSLATIRLFADDDEAAVREIIRSFARDCRLHFQQLEECLEREDHDSARRLAHKMLPMFKQFAIASLLPDLTCIERPDTPPEVAREATRRVIAKGREIISMIECSE
ncbi:MAG: response regulator [Odoribacteraceae bacterium]|jgi:signal transduction histidine kinase/CheY-like chemotaxis protein|nr:response regulator [Odoribacteraceae bacterium]